jgi:hypothetical protein
VLVAAVLAASLCLIDDAHAGIDLCLLVLAMILPASALVLLTPRERVVPCETPRITLIPPHPPRPPI